MHMVWAPDGHILAISNGRSCIHFFDTTKYYRVVKRTRVRNVSINDMYFTMNMKYFIIMTGRYVHNNNDKVGHIEVYSYTRSSDKYAKRVNYMYRVKAHDSTNRVMKIHKNEKLLVTGSIDGMVGIWDLKELVCLRMIDRFVSKTSFVDVSYDGSLIASSSEADTFMDIADVESGEAVDNIPGTTTHGCWHPTSYLLAYATIPTPPAEKDELDIGADSDDDRGYSRGRSNRGRNRFGAIEEESYIHIWGLNFNPPKKVKRNAETTSGAPSSSSGGVATGGGTKRYRSGDRKRDTRSSSNVE
jgi:WD40 repeat protein